jgi:threonine dehydrogenase-like Zn-dependent dehydrogenase
VEHLVVRVTACGICGTDLDILEGEFAPTLPIFPGHEFAGAVVAVGERFAAIGVTAPGAAADYALVEPLSCAVRGFDLAARTPW